jgi:DNA-directed RNA polymerase specialized sigma24 family protein
MRSTMGARILHGGHHPAAAQLDVERAVVMLRLLEERSGEDVAQTLALTRRHVDVLIHRAKASLRVCMRI